jgi:hypothetical protein
MSLDGDLTAYDEYLESTEHQVRNAPHTTGKQVLINVGSICIRTGTFRRCVGTSRKETKDREDEIPDNKTKANCIVLEIRIFARRIRTTRVCQVAPAAVRGLLGKYVCEDSG